ncbi:MAG: type II toxin-antitoxin system death-on-curing family toxin [Gammaproteobacteria bacterium]|jgi:death-on-curing protein
MSYVLLSVEQVVMVHDNILGPNELQGTAGGKFLYGALARVENRISYGLIDDVYALSAAYAAAISQAHCFNDGNKRTAFQVMDLVLDMNGVQVAWDTEAVGDKIIELAQSRLEDTAFADWLRQQADLGIKGREV